MVSSINVSVFQYMPIILPAANVSVHKHLEQLIQASPVYTYIAVRGSKKPFYGQPETIKNHLFSPSPSSAIMWQVLHLKCYQLSIPTKRMVLLNLAWE